jgi:hypothetical protein
MPFQEKPSNQLKASCPKLRIGAIGGHLKGQVAWVRAKSSLLGISSLANPKQSIISTHSAVLFTASAEIPS